MLNKRKAISIFTAAVLCASIASPALASVGEPDLQWPGEENVVDTLPLPTYEEALTSDDWELVPGGLAYTECIHEMPFGSEILPNGDIALNSRVIERVEPCPYPSLVQVPNEGEDTSSTETRIPSAWKPSWWLTSWWDSPAEITNFHVTWTVPNNPRTASGQTIFLFPSVTPTNGSAIAQPVLQWGSSAAGGGNYWALGNWILVGESTVYKSPLVSTAPGHTINGAMTRGNGTATNWTVGFVDVSAGSGAHNNNWNSGVSSWRAIQGGVFEVWGVASNQCNRLPNSTGTVFTHVTVTTVNGSATPAFSPHRLNTSCSSSVSATSSQTVVGWQS